MHTPGHPLTWLLQPLSSHAATQVGHRWLALGLAVQSPIPAIACGVVLPCVCRACGVCVTPPSPHPHTPTHTLHVPILASRSWVLLALPRPGPMNWRGFRPGFPGAGARVLLWVPSQQHTNPALGCHINTPQPLCASQPSAHCLRNPLKLPRTIADMAEDPARNAGPHGVPDNEHDDNGPEGRGAGAQQRRRRAAPAAAADGDGGGGGGLPLPRLLALLQGQRIMVGAREAAGSNDELVAGLKRSGMLSRWAQHCDHSHVWRKLCAVWPSVS